MFEIKQVSYEIYFPGSESSDFEISDFGRIAEKIRHFSPNVAGSRVLRESFDYVYLFWYLESFVYGENDGKTCVLHI